MDLMSCRAVTGTKDDAIKPARQFYFTTTDTRMLAWPYCYVPDRDSHRRRVNLLVREREEKRDEEFRTATNSPVALEDESDEEPGSDIEWPRNYDY
ncbi:salicylate hydroxylase [Apiospora arundinis]